MVLEWSHFRDEWAVAQGISDWPMIHETRARNPGPVSKSNPRKVIIYSIWVNLITTSLRPNPGIMVSKGNHPQMALFQVSEIL